MEKKLVRITKFVDLLGWLRLEKNVNFIDEDSVWVSRDGEVSVGGGSTIYPNVYLVGRVKIGTNCIIGPCSWIEDSSIGEGSEIGFGAQIKRSRLGSKVKAKHHCFLGDALVGDDVNIGAGAVTANYDGHKKNQTTIGDRAFIGVNANLVAPVTIGKEALVGAGAIITKDVPPHAVVVGKDRILEGKTRRRTEGGWKIIRIEPASK